MHINDGRVVSNFVIQALRGENTTIYGDGSQSRSFCYVDDLIDGMVRLMKARNDDTGAMNLGNPVEFTIRQLAEIILELVGGKSRLVFKPLLNDDPTAETARHQPGAGSVGLEAGNRFAGRAGQNNRLF